MAATSEPHHAVADSAEFQALLEEVDTNKDGKLALDEIKARWAEQFKEEFDVDQTPEAVLSLLERSDVDKSGFIESGEVALIQGGMETALEKAGPYVGGKYAMEVDSLLTALLKPGSGS